MFEMSYQLVNKRLDTLAQEIINRRKRRLTTIDLKEKWQETVSVSTKLFLLKKRRKVYEQRI